jgi:peptide/nickel transport system permease protein
LTTHELTGPELVADPLPGTLPLGRRLLKSARKRPLVTLGVTIVVGWLVVAVFAPLIAPYDPMAQTFTPGQSPSAAHLFGTDELGRDVSSRVVYGARVSLPLAMLVVFFSCVIGITLGVIAGYFRGALDGVIMRTTDLFFAFPAIILAFVVTASLGKGLQNAVLALVIVSWPAYARVVRGLVLTIGDSEYVAAGRLLGASSRRTIVRDVLPNFIGPVIVLAMLEVAAAILLLSGLSFLGLGAQAPTADWGGMASEGVDYFEYWWMSTFPGIAIFTVVLAFNFVGDGLRDIFDPRVRAGANR